MTLTPLTDEQFAHFEEAWRLFDTDGDGLVTPKDLQAILRSFGYEHSLVLCLHTSMRSTGAERQRRASMKAALQHIPADLTCWCLATGRA